MSLGAQVKNLVFGYELRGMRVLRLKCTLKQVKGLLFQHSAILTVPGDPFASEQQIHIMGVPTNFYLTGLGEVIER